MQKIIIYGTGKLAITLTKDIMYDQAFDIAAYTVNREYLTQDAFLGKPVVAYEGLDSYYSPRDHAIIMAIGYKNMRQRRAAFQRLQKGNFSTVNYIGSKVLHYNDFEIGTNNIIFNGTFLGDTGQLGDNNVVSRMANIGHDFEIGSHNYFAPGCNVGGYSRIGDLSFFGIGSTIIDNITISDETLLAAGSTITQNTKKQTLYAGCPAKPIKSISETGIIIPEKR